MRRVVLAFVLGCRPQPGPAAASPVSAGPIAAGPVVALVETPPGPPDDQDDRDGDGVPGAEDRCPDEAEDLDLFEDEDGCVDRDNDQDKILDASEFKDGRWTNCDRMIEGGAEVDCRNRPEDYDGDRDEDGCPDGGCLSECQHPVVARLPLDRGGRPVDDPAKVLGEVLAYMTTEPTHMIRIVVLVNRPHTHPSAWRIGSRVAATMIRELVRRGVARERLEPGEIWSSTEPAVDFTLALDDCCHPRRPAAPPEPQEPRCR